MTIAAPLTFGPALCFMLLALGVALLTRFRPWCGPAAIVATAPFAWYHGAGPTEITLAKAASAGAVIGYAALLARDRAARQAAASALKASPAVWLLAAFAIVSVLSIAWAVDSADAVRDALKWAWYAAVFALTIAAVNGAGARFKIAAVLLVTASAVALVGLWQNVTVAPAAFVASGGALVNRITATLEGPNQFGAYLETGIPLLIAVLLFGRLPRIAIVAGSVVLGVLVTNLLLTYSRGALWSCAAASVFLLAAYAFSVASRRTLPEPVPLVTAAAAAILAAAVIVPIARVSITSIGWQHELWTSGLRDTSDSAEQRKQLWTCAVSLIRRYPLAGVGAGNFADIKSDCKGALSARDNSNANQWYLETAADLGVIGLALLVSFLAFMLATARSAVLWEEPVAIGAYAVLLAFVLHGLVDDVMTYPKAALSFFVVLGLIPTRRNS